MVTGFDGLCSKLEWRSTAANCCAHVKASDMPEDDSSCNALFRVNYQDCYNTDYSIQRAQKLLDERRYNLVLRNCEHLIRWCKTGITNSIQVGVIWVSLEWDVTITKTHAHVRTSAVIVLHAPVVGVHVILPVDVSGILSSENFWHRVRHCVLLFLRNR